VYNAIMPAKERTVRTEAVVLRHRDWGEADRILWLYTQKMGKIQAIAKGIRKIRSRKAGHLEPFTRVNLMLARGRDFFIVTQVETIEAFSKLREDLIHIGYAAYVVELLDRFTYDQDDNQQIYRLLNKTLARVNSMENPDLPVRYFEVHLLSLLGYRPQLFNCAHCESEIQPEDQFFSISQGGVLCPKCGPKFADASQISLETLKYLRHFQRSQFSEVAQIRLSPEVNRNLEILMQQYFTYFLERNLNTPTFIRRVKRRSRRG
jgi:DNA repair protein RecO (recombination protein O)